MSLRWKLFITRAGHSVSATQPRGHLTDTAIMACELLVQLIVDERLDEQRKGLRV